MEQTVTCPHCGSQMPAEQRFCGSCGAPIPETGRDEVHDAQTSYPEDNTYSGDAVYPEETAYSPEPVSPAEKPAENVVAGIVGALLFSLGGAAVYFLLYQANFFSALSAVIMFVLANIGYGLFCGNKNSTSAVRVIVCVIVTAVMIFVAEYFCAAFEVYKAFKEEGMELDFFSAVRAMPELLKEDEFKKAFISELGIAYLLGAVAAVPSIIGMIKKKKAG